MATAVLLIAAACGGSDGETASAAASPTSTQPRIITWTEQITFDFGQLTAGNTGKATTCTPLDPTFVTLYDEAGTAVSVSTKIAPVGAPTFATEFSFTCEYMGPVKVDSAKRYRSTRTRLFAEVPGPVNAEVESPYVAAEDLPPA